MVRSIMSQAIDAEYGTFSEEVAAIWYAPTAITEAYLLTPYSGVWSYETGGGLMFEWVLGPDFGDDDE